MPCTPSVSRILDLFMDLVMFLAMLAVVVLIMVTYSPGILSDKDRKGGLAQCCGWEVGGEVVLVMAMVSANVLIIVFIITLIMVMVLYSIEVIKTEKEV